VGFATRKNDFPPKNRRLEPPHLLAVTRGRARVWAITPHGSAETWADLANALFDPVNGLVTRAYPTCAEREAFLKTEQYKKIRELLAHSIDTHGLVEGATPKKSGRFVVCHPHSRSG
jgi:hypothetical protein